MNRAKSIRPTSVRHLRKKLIGTSFKTVTRRGKYLLFEMKPSGRVSPFMLIGHLGMTGRMYLQPAAQIPQKHVAVVFDLGDQNFVFEDVRYFGRLTLDETPLESLGPEPLNEDFNGETLRAALRRSKQAIKVKLLDQSVVAGIGNIYASEALFRAGISPRKAARRLTSRQCSALVKSVRETLMEAIECGSTVPLDFPGAGKRDGLFYYGRADDAADYYEERLLVYGREEEPCSRCGNPIRRIVQSARSTYYCQGCQHD